MFKVLLATVLLVPLCNTNSHATNDALQECTASICPDNQIVKFDYTYKQHKTYHSPRPFMTSNIEHYGTLWVDNKGIAMRDSFTTRDRDYISLKTFKEGTLLNQPYNSKQPAKITRSMLAEEVFKIAKFHPSMLLQHFSKEERTNKKTHNKKYKVYSNRINNIPVSLFINKDNMLGKVTITIDDEMYGDVVYSINYSDYTEVSEGYPISYPQHITFSKVNGITDTIKLSLKAFVDKMPELIKKPIKYTVQEDQPKVPHTAHTEKISDHIYSVHLPQAESAALLVEFNDFFVVIDAPLNSKNGALVLAEAKKIAPNKTVRYYSFCHHHPWYLGGVRPFIHAGATVLTQAVDKDYINFLATTPRSLSPDALYNDPHPVQIEEVGKTKTITDGEYKMLLYHIGEQSEHTEDYTLFYFPEEKILFQGDMVFIKKDKPLNKARGKQLALYKALQKLDIEVETIVQAWPWKNKYNMKTIIPYSELEESVRLREEEN